MQHGMSMPDDILLHLKLKIYIYRSEFQVDSRNKTYYIKDISKSVDHSSRVKRINYIFAGKRKYHITNVRNVANTKRTIDVEGET